MNLQSTSDKPEGKALHKLPVKWKLQKVPLSLPLNHEKFHSPPQVSFLSQVSDLNNKARQNTLHLFLIHFTEWGLEPEANIRFLLPRSSSVTLKKFPGFLCFNLLNHWKYYPILPNTTYPRCPGEAYVYRKLFVANKAPCTCQIWKCYRLSISCFICTNLVF